MLEDSKYKKLLDIVAVIVIVLFVVQFINLKKQSLTTTITKSNRPQLSNKIQEEHYTKYLENLLSKKWKEIAIEKNKINSVYMVEVSSDRKLKSINCVSFDSDNIQANRIIVELIKDCFPLKPLPAEMRDHEIAFQAKFFENDRVHVHIYKKVKTTKEQIQHQKEINEWRKSRNLPQFPIKEYTYVSYSHSPMAMNPSNNNFKNITHRATNRTGTVQKEKIVATSRIMTDDEIKISRISSAYNDYMEYCVRSNWKNPTQNNEYSAAFTFNIDKDGRLTAYDVLRSSKSSEYDKAAIECLLDSTPFKPIPKELQMNGLNAQIYFNGVEVQVNAFSKPKPLTYNVDQSDKVCKTIEIEQTKRTRTQSMYPTSAPQDLSWKISKQVQQAWNPPLNKNSSVCLSFRVYRNGFVNNIEFVTKSYNQEADMAAYNAIKGLKLPPFSLESKKLFVDVKYWFYVEDNKIKN